MTNSNIQAHVLATLNDYLLLLELLIVFYRHTFQTLEIRADNELYHPTSILIQDWTVCGHERLHEVSQRIGNLVTRRLPTTVPNREQLHNQQCINAVILGRRMMKLGSVFMEYMEQAVTHGDGEAPYGWDFEFAVRHEGEEGVTFGQRLKAFGDMVQSVEDGLPRNIIRPVEAMTPRDCRRLRREVRQAIGDWFPEDRPSDEHEEFWGPTREELVEEWMESHPESQDVGGAGSADDAASADDDEL